LIWIAGTNAAVFRDDTIQQRAGGVPLDTSLETASERLVARCWLVAGHCLRCVAADEGAGLRRLRGRFYSGPRG
jgi:hypothetical protein